MSLLDRNIIVCFGEKKLPLREVIAQAAKQDGMTHVIYEPGEAPRMPTVKVVDEEGYEEAVSRYFGCQDFRRAIVIKGDIEISVFNESKRRREPSAKQKLEA